MNPNAGKTRRLVAWLVMGAWLAGNVGWLSYGNSLEGFDGLSVYVFAGPSALGQSLWMILWAIVAAEPRLLRIAGAIAGLSLAGFLVWSINTEFQFAVAMASCSLVGLAPAYWTRTRGWRVTCGGVRANVPVQTLRQVWLVDLFAITTLLAIWLGLGGFFARSELFDYVVFTGFLGAPVAIALLLAFGRNLLAVAFAITAIGAVLIVAAAYFGWIRLEIFDGPLGFDILLGLIEWIAVATVTLVLRACGYRWQLKQPQTPAADL